MSLELRVVRSRGKVSVVYESLAPGPKTLERPDTPGEGWGSSEKGPETGQSLKIKKINEEP